jgi:dienelactone hydrolase
MTPSSGSLPRALALALLPLALHGCGGGGGGGTASASGALSVSDCLVAGDESTCGAMVSWTTAAAESPQLLAGGNVLSTEANGSVTVDVGIEPVAISLRDGTRSLDEAEVRGSCAAASAWDGLRCLVFAIVSHERAPTPFVEDGAAVTLEVVVYTPVSASPPYPAVMFNHGSTGDGSDPSLFGVTYAHEGIARFFADRGWLVAFPQRRGRGQSDGAYDEGFEPDRSRYSCSAQFARPGFERALRDLDAAADYLEGRADVDAGRMLEAGFSRGGILAVAHVASRPATFLGAVNFVGGWIGEGCVDAVAVNREAFERGASFPGASIWLYAERDSFYGVAHSRANFDAFSSAGGTGEFHVFERAPALDGHFLINDVALWGPDLAAYLAPF